MEREAALRLLFGAGQVLSPTLSVDREGRYGRAGVKVGILSEVQGRRGVCWDGAVLAQR